MLREYSCGRRVLDLCCGTGSLCLHLARAGYDATGLDLSAGMLQILHERRAAEPAEVGGRLQTIQADACAFHLPGLFDFILLEDDSFVYLHTRDDQLACLSCVREHLAEQGHFFLQFTTPQRELLADEEYDYDELRQIKTLSCRWTWIDGDGLERQTTQGLQRRRLTWPAELELLLETAGLQVVHRWGDLDRTPFKDPAFQEYCYLMRPRVYRHQHGRRGPRPKKKEAQRPPSLLSDPGC
jgi:SAM-dependent methyltransferase